MEIDYKEKYEQAIERLKQWDREHPNGYAISERDEFIFPELKKSEEERIRMALIRRYSCNPEHRLFNTIDNIPFSKVVDWLEKQGKQKPLNKIKMGKEYKCIASPRYTTFIRGYIYKPKDEFLCSLMNFCSDCFEPIKGKQKSIDDLTAQEAMDITVDKCFEQGEQKQEVEGNPNARKPTLRIVKGKSYLCIKDYRDKNCTFTKGKIYDSDKDGFLVDDEEKDTFERKIWEEDAIEYFFLFEQSKTKDVITDEKQGEKGTKGNNGEIPNSDWSVEDEKFFKTALWHISYSVSNGKSIDIHCDTTDWLKSLKERYAWKPSDMELEVLRLAAEKDGACLMGLYEQLKKLKG